jgi:adenylate cyclase
MERRLAAILAADVVGYSAMMGADEAAALAAIRGLRDELFEPEVARWRGVVVKRLGDGWLVEFASVVDAVGCAVAAQERMAGEDVALRIGVHIGDIVHEDGDIYGDGVNIAARLETIGAAGHVAISDDARRQVAGRVDAQFHDNGPVTLKNIAEPVRVWSWPARLESLANALEVGAKPGLHIADFDHRGEGAEELARGIAEDLVVAFSRLTGLRVVADPDTAAYVLSGAIRAGRGRWRVSASLTDRLDGHSVWAEKYDEAGGDIFEIQDHVVYLISATVRRRVVTHEGAKHAGRPLEEMSAEQLLNLAAGCYATPTREAWESSLPILDQVLARDPENWMAMALVASTLSCETWFGWQALPTGTVDEMVRMIESAHRLNDDSDYVHMVHTEVLLYARRDLRGARLEIERALELNPNFAHGFYMLSEIEAYDGDGAAAIELAKRALDGDQRNPLRHLHLRTAGLAHGVAGDWAAAAEYFHRADRTAPGLPPNLIGLATSLRLSGDAAGAEAAMSALMTAAPDFNLAELQPWPFGDPAGWAPYHEALVALGAPAAPPLRVVEGGAA